MARSKNVKYSPERERDRQTDWTENGNITVVFLAEPGSDMKRSLLSIIIRDNSFFVLTSKLADWKGNACGYYIKKYCHKLPKISINNVHIFYPRALSNFSHLSVIRRRRKEKKRD